MKTVDNLAEKDFRRAFYPRMSDPASLEKNNALVEQLEALAQKHHVTPGQLALAWLLSKGDDVFPIPGTKQVRFLEENMGALAVLQRLTAADLKEIEDNVSAEMVAGTRYAGMSHSTYHAEKL